MPFAQTLVCTRDDYNSTRICDVFHSSVLVKAYVKIESLFIGLSLFRVCVQTHIKRFMDGKLIANKYIRNILLQMCPIKFGLSQGWLKINLPKIPCRSIKRYVITIVEQQFNELCGQYVLVIYCSKYICEVIRRSHIYELNCNTIQGKSVRLVVFVMAKTIPNFGQMLELFTP